MHQQLERGTGLPVAKGVVRRNGACEFRHLFRTYRRLMLRHVGRQCAAQIASGIDRTSRGGDAVPEHLTTDLKHAVRKIVRAA